MMETKRLYILAGGTDGYVDVYYSFDSDAISAFEERNDEMFGGGESNDSILVPFDSTYESLDISDHFVAEYALAEQIDDEENQ